MTYHVAKSTIAGRIDVLKEDPTDKNRCALICTMGDSIGSEEHQVFIASFIAEALLAAEKTGLIGFGKATAH